MLTFTYRTDREQYQADIRRYQSIYSHRLRKTRLIRLYSGSFWVFIASLVFLGHAIRNQFYGQTAIIVALFLIAAFTPINWYLNQQFQKAYSELVTADGLGSSPETKVVFDEAGIQLEALNSTYQVAWSGVGKAYLVDTTLLIFCETNFIMVPLNRCQPVLEPAAVQAEFEQLSGKSIEAITTTKKYQEDNENAWI